MERLDGNGRYGTPTGACYKLGKDEEARVQLAGFYKGYVRCGKAAYACVFLRCAESPDTWIYVSKGAFIDLVFLLQRDALLERPFWVCYNGSSLDVYTDDGRETYHEQRREIGHLVATYGAGILRDATRLAVEQALGRKHAA